MPVATFLLDSQPVNCHAMLLAWNDPEINVFLFEMSKQNKLFAGV